MPEFSTLEKKNVLLLLNKEKFSSPFFQKVGFFPHGRNSFLFALEHAEKIGVVDVEGMTKEQKIDHLTDHHIDTFFSHNPNKLCVYRQQTPEKGSYSDEESGRSFRTAKVVEQDQKRARVAQRVILFAVALLEPFSREKSSDVVAAAFHSREFLVFLVFLQLFAEVGARSRLRGTHALREKQKALVDVLLSGQRQLEKETIEYADDRGDRDNRKQFYHSSPVIEMGRRQDHEGDFQTARDKRHPRNKRTEKKSRLLA
jgi:hypothetical protein